MFIKYFSNFASQHEAAEQTTHVKLNAVAETWPETLQAAFQYLAQQKRKKEHTTEKGYNISQSKLYPSISTGTTAHSSTTFCARSLTRSSGPDPIHYCHMLLCCHVLCQHEQVHLIEWPSCHQQHYQHQQNPTQHEESE
jgi:hypothetical protein